MSEENVRKTKKAFGHFGQENKKCPRCPKNVRSNRTKKNIEISNITIQCPRCPTKIYKFNKNRVIRENRYISYPLICLI